MLSCIRIISDHYRPFSAPRILININYQETIMHRKVVPGNIIRSDAYHTLYMKYSLMPSTSTKHVDLISDHF
jgi:hypothetical protein